MSPIRSSHRLRRILRLSIILGLCTGMIYLGASSALSGLGRLLVRDEPPPPADAVVVLNGGVEYYPRLIAAAALYGNGLAAQVVINGNRKVDALRRLEAMGYERGCPWHDEGVRILTLLGVPTEKIMTVSAEDAYDTISEARAVAPLLINNGMRRIIITTSGYHTRRAGHIWERLYGKELDVSTVAAREDAYDPDGWWREGRQIRWVMAEYGAWLFYFKQMVSGAPLFAPTVPD